MENELKTKLIKHGFMPENPKIELPDSFTDNRGIIQNLLLSPINSVAVITSKAGSIRSNHYHKTDWHYLYVLSGSLKYYERDLNEESKEPRTFKTGDMFFTGPMKVHKVEFLEDTVLISMAKNVRDHEHHEEDVVREEY